MNMIIEQRVLELFFEGIFIYGVESWSVDLMIFHSVNSENMGHKKNCILCL